MSKHWNGFLSYCRSERTNVIFLLSLLYISLFIKVKMQQYCQNLVRSSLLPENGEGIFNLISLGEVVDTEEEAMLWSLGGSRFSWEKRSMREFGSLGLGSKWKESDKGSASSMLFFLFLHWGSPQCLFVHLVYTRWRSSVCLWEYSFVMTLRS